MTNGQRSYRYLTGAQFGNYPTYTQKERPSRLHCMIETLGCRRANGL